ncbi:efflux RND transporter permease subunit [Thalassomonas sp. M1454]|uniref:efflux RND transporter permease subunit n=1 Tax=Thalassomonas sp. M1454 TaxID=2594477 RepID=UPI00117D5D08|nr:efflux RND transporter permease subunit [Thalassomonas sp. M1454]TRX57498.1 efflux RND transporter permease subunit [Thalassomonas sp. M1454]
MKLNFIDAIVARSLKGGIPLFIFIVSIMLGILALNATPREEEPQIVVPMVDVMVEVPNLTAKQVERQVTVPLEKLLTQISGVEHIYSTSLDGKLQVTLRFFVGQDRELAILNTYNKLYSNQNSIPAVVSNWLVKPIEVDDVPIVMLGLYSTDSKLYNDYELRRVAQEISTLLQSIDNTSEVKVVGGRARTLAIELDLQALAARKTDSKDVIDAIALSNELIQHQSIALARGSVLIESGDVLTSIAQLKNLVVNIVNGKAIYLKDVANIYDGASEVDNYQWLEFANKSNNLNAEQYPLVTLSVAKQRGSNAVSVSNAVLAKMAELKQSFLPKEIHYEVLRDYGQTANEKVNNLTSSLAFAVFTVVVFIGVFLGWRPAIVVGLAIPVCYGLTLFLDLVFGYTINRVTLFALILSLGLLVDDPITGIDNIERFIKQKGGNTKDKIVNAISEIRPALLMSTLTIVLAFIPLAFITGMMGPYMAPMAFNVPLSVISSTLVAFLVTPWLASKILKPNKINEPATTELDNKTSLYSKWLSPLITNKARSKKGLWIVLALFIASAALPILRIVPLKLLPFDNKNEIQVLIDMPESASLQQTAAMAKKVIQISKQLPEISAIASYVGEPSPIDFNGLVRGYYQRKGPRLADLRLTLVDKSLRQHQSHGVVLRLRKLLEPLHLGTNDIVIKVVEVPPGPPVLSTLVAEVYATPFVSQETHNQAAQQVMQRFKQEAHVVEVDSSLVAKQEVQRFIIDKQKAALSGISTLDANTALAVAVSGKTVGIYQQQNEAKPVPIEVRLAYEQRNDLNTLLSMQVKGRNGIAQLDSGVGLEQAPQNLVSLAELGKWQTRSTSQPILHKDLAPVIYVTAELSGRTPAEVIADMSSDQNKPNRNASHFTQRTYLSSGSGIGWSLPEGTNMVFSGEGEWKITIDVFRDMGIAFAFALTGIFIVLKWQTTSTALALIIMSSIPLTIIGIMPGFWLMNLFGEREIAGAPEPVLFTATAMIGMIALAGIVVRNSLILVEFITLARERGATIKEALLSAGSVRMRPVLLTAGTTLLGNLIITLDPVFNGLALAIIFGIISSTLFSLFVVPMVYFLIFTDNNEKPVNNQGSEISELKVLQTKN